MKQVYPEELPHFLKAIRSESDNARFCLPNEMVEEISNIITDFYKQMMMKIMSIFSKKSNKDSQAEELYKLLNTEKFKIRPFQIKDMGEKMAVVDEAIGEYWKPRFLLDHRAKKAYEFMNRDCRLLTVTRDDIDWESLKGLEKSAIEVAKELSFYYPSFILQYENDVAEVRWQLNPDGMYYMDEDGFGMTNDVEVNIYGVIDRAGKVVEKFKYDNEEDFDDEEDD